MKHLHLHLTYGDWNDYSEIYMFLSLQIFSFAVFSSLCLPLMYFPNLLLWVWIKKYTEEIYGEYYSWKTICFKNWCKCVRGFSDSLSFRWFALCRKILNFPRSSFVFPPACYSLRDTAWIYFDRGQANKYSPLILLT
jgi:hypothetical protein